MCVGFSLHHVWQGIHSQRFLFIRGLDGPAVQGWGGIEGQILCAYRSHTPFLDGVGWTFLVHVILRRRAWPSGWRRTFLPLNTDRSSNRVSFERDEIRVRNGSNVEKVLHTSDEAKRTRQLADTSRHLKHESTRAGARKKKGSVACEDRKSSDDTRGWAAGKV